MTETTILTNARIVCPDKELNGTLVIEDEPHRRDSFAPYSLTASTCRVHFLFPA